MVEPSRVALGLTGMEEECEALLSLLGKQWPYLGLPVE